MTRPSAPFPPPNGPVLRSLYTAAVMVIEFPPEAGDGTYLYCYRLCGIARRMAVSEGRLGPILRLQGEFLAAREGSTWAARSLIATDTVAAAVRRVFDEHPKRSSRDRVRVNLDFDLWALREAAAPLGYRMQADGRAWVPEPLTALIASSLARPLPEEPQKT